MGGGRRTSIQSSKPFRSENLNKCVNHPFISVSFSTSFIAREWFMSHESLARLGHMHFHHAFTCVLHARDVAAASSYALLVCALQLSNSLHTSIVAIILLMMLQGAAEGVSSNQPALLRAAAPMLAAPRGHHNTTTTIGLALSQSNTRSSKKTTYG